MRKRELSQRRQRIAREGIMKVVKPWTKSPDEANELCNLGVTLMNKDKYDQKQFFHHVIYEKLTGLVDENKVTSQTRSKLMTMLKSEDVEMEGLALESIKSTIKLYGKT